MKAVALLIFALLQFTFHVFPIYAGVQPVGDRTDARDSNHSKAVLDAPNGIPSSLPFVWGTKLSTVKVDSHLCFGSTPMSDQEAYFYSVRVSLTSPKSNVPVAMSPVNFRIPKAAGGKRKPLKNATSLLKVYYHNLQGAVALPMEHLTSYGGYPLYTDWMGHIDLTFVIPPAAADDISRYIANKRNLRLVLPGIFIQKSSRDEFQYFSITKSTFQKLASFFKVPENLRSVNGGILLPAARRVSRVASALVDILLRHERGPKSLEPAFNSRIFKRDGGDAAPVRYVDHYANDIGGYIDERSKSLALFFADELDRIQAILLRLLDVADAPLPKILDKIALYFSWAGVQRTSKFFKHYFVGMNALSANATDTRTSLVEWSIRQKAQDIKSDMEELKAKILPKFDASGTMEESARKDPRVQHIQQLAFNALQKFYGDLDNQAYKDDKFIESATEFAQRAAKLAEGTNVTESLQLNTCKSRYMRFPGGRAVKNAYAKSVNALFRGLEALVVEMGAATAKSVALGMSLLPSFVAKFYHLLSMRVNVPYFTTALRKVIGLKAGDELTALDIVSLMVAAPVHYTYITYTSEAPFSQAEVDALDSVQSPLEYARVFHSLPGATKSFKQLSQRHEFLLRAAFVSLTWADIYTFRTVSPATFPLIVGQGYRTITPINSFLLGTLLFPTAQTVEKVSAEEYGLQVAQSKPLAYHRWLSWMTFTCWKLTVAVVDLPTLYIGPKLLGSWKLTSSGIASYVHKQRMVDALLGGVPQLLWSLASAQQMFIERSHEYTGSKELTRYAQLSVAAPLMEGLGYVLRIGGSAWSGTSFIVNNVAGMLYSLKFHSLFRNNLYEDEILN